MDKQMNNEKTLYMEEMTNEEYREELKKIFETIEDNQKLRFWYRYIKGVEKGRD